MTTYKKVFDDLFSEMSKVIVGQDEVIQQLVIAIMANSNALLEGYPGVAKTMMVKTLAKLMDLKFSRIQNTPDLMPSDITGTNIIEEQAGKRQFKFQPGPIFANVVLSDEINRATPKTQSALLEAMQEKQVTIGNVTYRLDLPFFVLATQNPIEQEGTYPLPEAQADRFLLKIKVKYPKYEEELEVVNRYAFDSQEPRLRAALSRSQVLQLQQLTRQVPIANDIKERAVKIVTTTREVSDLLAYGASPRASIGIILAAKARALINGRNYVSVEDIHAMAYPILRHRIILNFESERKGLTSDDVIEQVIKKVR